MDTTPLSQDHLDHYWKHGYAVVPRLLPQADLERWLERFDDVVEGRIEPARQMLVMRDVMVVRGAVEPTRRSEAIAKLQDFENDAVLDGYNQHPILLDAVEQLIGPDIQSIHCMLINKPPNVDGRHPMHQDLVYFPFRPADGIVAVWTALEPVTRENGCLVLVPGSHRGELLEHENMDWEYVNAGYWGAKGGPPEDRVHVECAPGDTVFFHPMILHGSGRNRTQGFRRAISCHYASTQCDRIWQAKDEAAEPRKYRHIRGKPARAGDVPLDVRPGAPSYDFPKSTTRRG